MIREEGREFNPCVEQEGEAERGKRGIRKHGRERRTVRGTEIGRGIEIGRDIRVGRGMRKGQGQGGRSWDLSRRGSR